MYVLKERTVVSRMIELFYKDLNYQFSKSIHVLHIDNDMEYMKLIFLYFILIMELLINVLLSYAPTKWYC